MNLQQVKVLRTISKIVLVLTGLFLLGYIGYVVYMGVRYKPYKVRVTNVTDSAFTVSWITDSPMPGIVYYGEKDTFLPGPLSWIGKKKAVDDRDSSDAMSECVSKFNKKAAKSKDVNFTVDASSFDCNNVRVWKYGRYYTHHVTVQNLDAKKEYFFRVGDGVISYGKNRGVYVEGEVGGVSEFKAKTFALFKDFSQPIPAYGTVETAYRHKDGYFLLEKDFDSIVFLTVKTPGMDPILFSSVSNSDGGWSMDLSNSRMEDGRIVDISDAIMSFIPQSQNHWSARSREYKYKDLIFPLNLAANQEEDTREEIAGVSDKFIKDSEAVSIIAQSGGNKGRSSRESSTYDKTSTSGKTSTPDKTSTPSKTSTPDKTSTPSKTSVPDKTSTPGKTSTSDITSKTTSAVCQKTGESGPLTFCGDCYYRMTLGGNPSAATCRWEHAPGDYSCYDPLGRGCNIPGLFKEDKPSREDSGVDEKPSSEGSEQVNKQDIPNVGKSSEEQLPQGNCYKYDIKNINNECYSIDCATITGPVKLSKLGCENIRKTLAWQHSLVEKKDTFFINIQNVLKTGLQVLTQGDSTVCCPVSKNEETGEVEWKILKSSECASAGKSAKDTKLVSYCIKQEKQNLDDGVRRSENKFSFDSFAQSTIQEDDMILYLPNSGIYSVNSSTYGSNSFYLVGGEDRRYAFYEDRNGVEGYQQPVDPLNPKDNEDLLLSQSALGISVSHEVTAQEISLKQGINIISFNFMPSLGEKKPLSSGDFLKIANERGYEVSRISYFAGGSWNGGNAYNVEKEEVSGVPFDLVFGKGYVVVAERDTTISIPGYEIKESVPVAFSSGWNLIGVHGYSTAYTARTLIESINTIEGLKSDNVTWWPTSRGMYQGYQLINGQSYGQDYPISPLNGYFVRVSEFNPKDTSCKTILWNPGGTHNAQCSK